MGGLMCAKEIINARVAAMADGTSEVAEIARAGNVMVAAGALSEEEMKKWHDLDVRYLAGRVNDADYVKRVSSILGISTP